MRTSSVAATSALAPALFALLTSARPVRPAAAQPVADSGRLVLHLRGLPAGEETWVRRGDSLVATSRLSFGPGLDVRVVLGARNARGERPLTSSGRPFPWLATPPSDARSLPITSALPTSLLGAIVDRWEELGRPARLDAPETPISVRRCGLDTIAGRPAHCHLIAGIGWGRALVWRSGGAVRGAFVPTPLGAVVALPLGERADRLLALAARRVAGEIAPRTSPAPSSPLAIVGARVVALADTGALRAPLDDATVVIVRGRITAVGPRGTVRVPPGARVLDARGATLIPGLWDMHAHLKQGEWLPAYLAAGITSVRDVGSDEPFLRSLRRLLDPSPGSAPRIVASAFLNPPATGRLPYTAAVAGTAEEARALVTQRARSGYDGVKLWNGVPAAAARAAIATAHRHGMRVIWHLPDDVSPMTAAMLGVDGIEHVWGFLESLGGERLGPDAAALLATLRERRIVVDPTLVVAAYQNRSRNVPLAQLDPCAGWMPLEVRRAWSAFGVAPADSAAGARTVARAMRATYVLDSAGVAVVAGSDQGLPGCAVHHELELLVAAGLSPRAALRAATVNAAQAVGLTDDVGTIEPGKRADVVLIDGDPLADIRAVRRVRLVVRAGVVHDPATSWRRALLSREADSRGREWRAPPRSR